jgi:hypothetical protein
MGVVIQSSSTGGNLIEGNFIGTNAAGTGALGNTLDGVNVFFANNNTIGGSIAGKRNFCFIEPTI